MEDKKLEEKKSQKPMDAVEMERMKHIPELLQEYLSRKYGLELEIQEEQGPENEPPELAIYAVWGKDKTVMVDAQTLIPKFPDWLKPFAKARMMAGGNLLLLWWGKSHTPQAKRVFDGVTAELSAMGPAVETDNIEEEEV